jgi:hypothetical protein
MLAVAESIPGISMVHVVGEWQVKASKASEGRR